MGKARQTVLVPKGHQREGCSTIAVQIQEIGDAVTIFILPALQDVEDPIAVTGGKGDVGYQVMSSQPQVLLCT
jgi:hypothetical protein